MYKVKLLEKLAEYEGRAIYSPLLTLSDIVAVYNMQWNHTFVTNRINFNYKLYNRYTITSINVCNDIELLNLAAVLQELDI